VLHCLRTLCYVSAGVTLATSTLADVDEPPIDSVVQQIRALRDAIDEQAGRLEQQQSVLDREKQSLRSQRQELERLTRQIQPDDAAAAGPLANAQTHVGIAPTIPDAVDLVTLPERLGVLTPVGTWGMDSSIQYSHSSSQRVSLLGFSIVPAILVGEIDVRDIESQTTAAAFSIRYGLIERMEVELRTPYLWRRESVRSRPLGQGADHDSIFEPSGSGLGDVELTLRRQLNSGAEGGPLLVGNLRVRAPTGTDPFSIARDPVSGLATRLATGSGFWGVESSLTTLVRNDPAVFFSTLSYLWNVESHDIDPGDVVGLDFGMGFAVNDRLSFTLGYEHRIVMPAQFEHGTSGFDQRAQLGSLLLGYSLALDSGRSLQLTLSAGLTADAPDVQLAVLAPFSASR
jgi:hypothetical protein